MLTPFIMIVVVFRFMDSLKMFDIIFAMTEGGPGNTLMTYQLTAYRIGIQFQKLAQGLPYAIVLYIVIYFVSQPVNGWIKRRGARERQSYHKTRDRPDLLQFRRRGVRCLAIPKAQTRLAVSRLRLLSPSSPDVVLF